MRYPLLIVRWCLAISILALISQAAFAADPPVAARHPTTVSIGGQQITDDYWWLRKKDDPAVIDYLKAENKYADALLKPTESLQKKLFDEVNDRFPDVNETVPYRMGNWWYSTRDADGQDYAVYQRRRGSPTAKAETMIDCNKLAEGHAFFDFGSDEPSPDGNILAFSTDITGNRQYMMQFKDLRTGRMIGTPVPLVDSFTWMRDNRTLYYIKQDDAKRSYRLYRHTLGWLHDTDELVYEEKDVQSSLTAGFSRDRKWIFCQSESNTASEVRVMPSDRIADPVVIEPRRADHQYYIDERDGRFYIRTNDVSRNFRLVTTPVDAPHSANWTQLLAADPNIVLNDFDVFAHDIVLSERREGLPRLAIAKLPDAINPITGGPSDFDPAKAGELKPVEISFPEPEYNVSVTENMEYDPSAIRIAYTSLTTPYSDYDISLTDGKQTLLKQQFVGNDFKRDDYGEKRLFATAADGTKIPVSVVYRKPKSAATQPDATPSGRLILTAYGSYGDPNDVSFNRMQLSLLDRGVICAVAHVRGGGEYGRPWYDGGRMKNKDNTFSDFIAVTKYLQDNGWTTPKQTAITGASAGGLLIGAVVNREPKLYRAAVAQVPWVDVLADMSDPTVPLTTLEYKEWGDPNVPEERAWIAKYDPVENVRPQPYPDILVTESLNDSQVQYWDAARWVACLRAAEKTAGDKSQLILKMDMDSGHDGPSGQDAEIHQEALVDAWILNRLGIKK